VENPPKQQSFREKWAAAIARAGAPLCVGLDPDPEKLPESLGNGHRALERFVLKIIESTRDLVAAYKPNTAFFEAYGPDGIMVLERLREFVGPDVLLIADAKRGDVSHTNEAYALSLFGRIGADAVTVQPYMGGEPLEPFVRDPARAMFVLCATSNPGAEAVQSLDTGRGPLYLEIARQARTWSLYPNVGLVLGTTKPDAVEAVVNAASDMPLLLPGGGAQGGETQRVYATLKEVNATGLFTFSRSVIYASSGPDYAQAARQELLKLRDTFAA
jgi:orotidine-5'-phosphate decarboxylase